LVSVPIVFVITIPSGTSTLTFNKESIPFTGKLTKIFVDIPLGWNYSSGIQIRIGTKTKFPVSANSDTEETLTGDDIDLEFSPNFPLDDEKISIYGVTNDTVEDQFCVVTCEVELEE